LIDKPQTQMKKLERMDGKLFESLKENEMSQIGQLVGGYWTTQTNGGKDTTYHYESTSNTYVGVRCDLEKTVQNGSVTLDPLVQDAFTVSATVSAVEEA
jgi:hypothetical protein